MSYCPKCGAKVDPTMTFCPNCGAPLKATPSQPAPAQPYPPYYRPRHHEKDEKQNEKQGEKGSEKYEKGGGGIGYLIGGIVVVLLGVLAYINATGLLKGVTGQEVGASFLVLIGIIIVIAGVYYSTRSRRRNPAPV